MLLVYTHKITPRLTYIFKQLFVRMLHLPIEFTTTIEVFVAHSGPKISYTQAPLGDAFFVAAHNLLFEQGVQEQLIEMDEWEGLPIFFKTSPSAAVVRDYLRVFGRIAHSRLQIGKNTQIFRIEFQIWIQEASHD